ncbi:hypothetical protein MKK69_19370 [Methylobacterium sp. J-026]|uniref:hypothetical protein n=1 Tax=Methylobacterium sp. J-026 TaxID=2836624 RepID=UPI001FBAA58E|nr:hypothetical protein [Methylobacterium sp. J-026]MCJ2136184.1 hypothetical protein [Methylobacterium sp. J-026]
MPHGARTSLVALFLLAGLGGASAEPAAGSTWTDPPAHKSGTETRPAADRKAAAPVTAAPTAATPAASQEARSAPAARRAVAARRAPERKVAHAAVPSPKRVAAAPRRVRIAAPQTRMARDPRFVAVAPPPPPAEGYARYRSYGYAPGSAYGPGYADDRLERLRSAEAAGYLVVRRRTVQFPDGRSLRVYHPDDEGEPF